MQLKKSILAISMVGVTTITYAENNSYFEDDTSTRFSDERTEVKRSSNNLEITNPTMLVKAFELKDFYEDETSGVLLTEVQELVKKDLDDRKGRYTVNALRELTNSLTEYYRQKGLVLAKAYIPEQKISKGVVIIQLITGVLSEIEVKNNAMYPAHTLEQPFNVLVGKPVNSAQFNEAILRFSDYPGVDVSSSLSPGVAPGTTKLILDVQKESPLTAYAGIDNYGKESTGRNRAFLGINLNNPSNSADRLWGQFITSYMPFSAQSTNLNYELPLDGFLGELTKGYMYDTDLQVSFKTSRFEVTEDEDLEDLDIAGNSQQLETKLKKDLKREGYTRMTADVSLATKSSETEANDNTFAETSLTVFKAGFSYQGRDSILNGASNHIYTSVSFGIPEFLGSMGAEDQMSGRQDRNGNFSGGEFTKLNIEAQRVQAINDQYLSIKFLTQQTSDMLVSQEVFAIGGQNNVRGYPVGDQIADSAFYLGLEYIGYSYASKLSLPVTNLKAAAFMDYASGRLNNPTNSDQETMSAMSVGVYGSFQFAKKYQMRMDLGVPMPDLVGADEPTDDTNFQIVFNLTRSF